MSHHNKFQFIKYPRCINKCLQPLGQQLGVSTPKQQAIVRFPAVFFVEIPKTPFNLQRCGRVVFARWLFVVTNLRVCMTIVFENEFSNIVPQSRQSLIATTSLRSTQTFSGRQQRGCRKKFSVLILLSRLFLLLARHSLQAASALASCVGSVFRFLRHFLMALNGNRAFSP